MRTVRDRWSCRRHCWQSADALLRLGALGDVAFLLARVAVSSPPQPDPDRLHQLRLERAAADNCLRFGGALVLALCDRLAHQTHVHVLGALGAGDAATNGGGVSSGQPVDTAAPLSPNPRLAVPLSSPAPLASPATAAATTTTRAVSCLGYLCVVELLLKVARSTLPGFAVHHHQRLQPAQPEEQQLPQQQLQQQRRPSGARIATPSLLLVHRGGEVRSEQSPAGDECRLLVVSALVALARHPDGLVALQVRTACSVLWSRGWRGGGGVSRAPYVEIVDVPQGLRV